jgi:hypothetical protein
VILRALKLEPEYRYQKVNQLRRALNKPAETTTTVLPKPGTSRPQDIHARPTVIPPANQPQHARQPVATAVTANTATQSHALATQPPPAAAPTPVLTRLQQAAQQGQTVVRNTLHQLGQQGQTLIQRRPQPAAQKVPASQATTLAPRPTSAPAAPPFTARLGRAGQRLVTLALLLTLGFGLWRAASPALAQRFPILAPVAGPISDPDPIASPVQARVREDLNLRVGPSTDYPIIAAYLPGTTLTVHGLSADGNWLKVTTSDGETGWMYLPFLDIQGDPATLPIVEE